MKPNLTKINYIEYYINPSSILEYVVYYKSGYKRYKRTCDLKLTDIEFIRTHDYHFYKDNTDIIVYE